MTDTNAEAIKLLTVDAVARQLTLHPETVRRWLRDGRLRGIRLGERRAGWRISQADLDAFLSSRSTRKGSDDGN
jgi:excisionase family DNA binding protein